MHVVIVGCGRVGSSLALQLTESGHTAAVIDRSAAAFDRFLEDWPGNKVVGFGFDRDTLASAGVEQADALAAVTSGDNTNIIVARVAKETYRVPRVVARIYDPRRASVYERLGISTVATVDWTTDQALRRLLPDASPPDWVHGTGDLAVVERRVPESLIGRSLAEVERDGKWRVIGLSRLGQAGLPPAGAIAQENDVVILAVTGDALAELDQALAGQQSGAH
ncbi:MAG: TrkA family potassium uptake protein [Acidobacteria bacterium]|nr:TrkA family potassium uptake protein [Acidobacteriota bacterium]